MKKSGFFTKMRLLQAMLVTATMLLVMAFAPSQNTAEDEWTLLASESGVNAYAMETDCGGQSKYLIKIENTSLELKSFKLTYELKGSQAYGPRTESYTLNPSETKEGSCKTGKLLVLPDYEKTPGSTSDKVKIEIVRNP
jgi:hypothetical protein